MALILLQDAPVKSDGSAPAPGAAGGAAPPPGANLIMFAPLVIIMIVMFFTSSRRQKKEAEARRSMQRGQRVVSNSGLVGELVDIDERFAKVKIAPGTTVQMLATSISPLPAAGGAAADAAPLADLKEAKASAKK